MPQQEFQKSTLAVELKAGKKRLEDALLGLSDEQCVRVWATRYGSVVDLLSEIVTREFVALMEVSERLPGPARKLIASGHGPTPSASGRELPAPNESIENLLTEFGVLRSAIVRHVEDPGSHGATVESKYVHVADVCVTMFNEQMDELERWHNSQIVGFSRVRLRAEAREAELNQAVAELTREDFLAGNFDLKSLFSVLFDGFYSEDAVLWFGAEVITGRAAALERMENLVEPITTLLEMGLVSIVSFRATQSTQSPEGNFITDWETVFGGTDWAGTTLRWRTVRAWKSRKVIAERIERLSEPPEGEGRSRAVFSL
jgi:hypothetical protein